MTAEVVPSALGQLVGAAKEGLLALSVGVGLGVLEELMSEEVEEVCGPKGKHDPDRVAYRRGTDEGEVTLGGRRVQLERPRMRSRDGESEVPVQTYEHFASRDQLSRVVLERMLAGVSTRRYRRLQEPVDEQVERSALLAHGARINGQSYPSSALFAAAGRGDVAMISLLLENGADPNKRETVHNVGATPLHEAACHGQLGALRTLLGAGADPTIRDEQFDSTPAGWAEHFGKRDAVKALEAR